MRLRERIPIPTLGGTVKRRLTVALTLLLITVGLTATPAYASLSECASGWVCLYDNANFSVKILSTFGNRGTCVNIPSYANDRADSFYNKLNNGTSIRIYQDANCVNELYVNDPVGDGCLLGPFPDLRAYNICNRPLAHGGHVDINKLTSIRYQ
jgi:hypothetical protein